MPIEAIEINNPSLRKGTVAGGVLLLSGSCIGAGMLALPALTAFAGFLPTTLIFTLCWLFMASTALLLIEANMWFSDQPNLVTLSAFLNASWIGLIAAYFAFFAIVTSLFGQALSVFDFLSDGLRIPRNTQGRAILCVATFLPSYIFSQLFPNIFFLALELVGGVAAMLLFGLLPVAMVWEGRYGMGLNDHVILPGGKLLLTIIAGMAGTVLSYEIVKHLR